MLLGRDSLLGRVCELLAAEKPTALLGDAGVGKTTLMRAAAVAGGRPAFEGGGFATLRWRPYLALSRAVGVEFTRGDDLYIARQVERLVGDGVLLVDDAHWLDDGTRAVLPLLARRVPLLIGIGRAEAGTDEALDLATGMSCEIVEVDPLERADALALVEQLRPDLPPTAMTELVRRAAGRPLLIREMSIAEEPSTSLRDAIDARLRGMPDDARTAMAMLAIAGRPIPATVVHDGADPLVFAGLAERPPDGSVALRHSLLGETFADTLVDEERRSVHSRLAQVLPDPSECARHHAAAGERDAAVEKARLAVAGARWPSERAAHLRLAAECASGAEADEFRLKAAGELLVVQQSEAMLDVLASVEGADDSALAELHYLRCLALWLMDDPNGSNEARIIGLEHAKRCDSPFVAMLLVAQVRHLLHVDNEPAAALAVAEDALRVAEAHGSRYLAHVLYILGGAQFYNGLDVLAQQTLTRAAQEAKKRGDVRTEARAWRDLANMHAVAGRMSAARALWELLVVQLDAANLTSDLLEAKASLLWLLADAGEYAAVIEEGEAMLALSPDGQIEAGKALARAWLNTGEFEKARALIDTGLAHADIASDRREWVALRAWGYYWEGKPSAALATVRFSHGDLGTGVALMQTLELRTCAAWAGADLGEGPVDPVEPPPYPMLAPAAVEIDALRARAVGDDALALTLFDEAAEAWAGMRFAEEMRCRWGAAEALQRIGDQSCRARLEAVEDMAATHGMKPLLARIHRSMSLAGVPTRRSVDAGL